MPIINGSRRRPSTIAPTISPSTRNGIQRAAFNQPTSVAEPCRVRMTTICSANNVTYEPNPDTAAARQ